MAFTYIFYLALTAIGALLIQRIFHIKLNFKAAITTICIAGIVFLAWDMTAVAMNHWSFGWEHMLGIQIINQPLEELAFFVIVPFFGLVVWELFGEKNVKGKY